MTKMKDKILIWFRNNWFIVILVILLIIAFFFLRKWGTGYFDYKRENKALSDTITKYEVLYHQALDRVGVAQELIDSYENELMDFQARNDSIETRKDEQERYFRSRITNLTRIPTDSLYRDVTTWLDSLSAEWRSD